MEWLLDFHKRRRRTEGPRLWKTNCLGRDRPDGGEQIELRGSVTKHMSGWASVQILWRPEKEGAGEKGDPMPSTPDSLTRGMSADGKHQTHQIYAARGQ